MNNSLSKPAPRPTIKARLKSASKEGTAQLAQPRIAIINPAYRNVSADKHKNHSIDNLKKIKLKTTKKKKVKKQIVQELENEDERLLLEQELKRRADLDKFTKEQNAKMSEEERLRLKKEEKDRLDLEQMWDKQINELNRKQSEINEWQNYITCNTNPDPRSEKDLNTLVFQLLQNNDQDDQKIIQKQISHISNIIQFIQQAQLEDISQNIYNKQEYYQRYLVQFIKISNDKVFKIVKKFIRNYESFLDENNKILRTQFFLPEFTYANSQLILKRLAQKQDEKSKYEIMKYSDYHPQFQCAFWYNPISKAGYRIKPVDYSQLYALNVQLPRQLVGNALIQKVVWTKWDPFQNFKFYDQYLNVSGICQVECLELPQLTKKTQFWSLLPSLDIDNQLIKPIKLNSLGFQPFNVSFIISKQYYVQSADELFIVTFQEGKWTRDAVEELKINLQNRLVSFNLKQQLPFTLAINRFLDFPFKTWKICSQSQKKISLILTTQRDIRISVDITQDFVELVEPKQILEQFPIFQQKMSAAGLLLNLRGIGINLLAQEEDAICLQTVFKLSELENQVVLNLMQIVKQFTFKMSPINRQTGADQINVQFVENPLYVHDFEGDDEFKWKYLDFQINKVALVKENGNEWLGNTVSHANLLLLLQQHEISPPDILDHVEEVSEVQLKTNLRNMVKMMRLFSIN